ncbi:MAG TPA: hypothetical protein VGE08_06440 [Steroidobacter sp.]|uniref:CopD family copper resistance protein n=1 Tax=Steroidobacter sp. TaxID=1978227 RepID=UPI002EDB222E
MSYPVLLTLHLFGALIFIGTVFFEVLMLEAVRKDVDRAAMRAVEQAIGRRARRIMPWVLMVIYGAGIGMAWHYRAVLADPWQSTFGTLLALKIVLAISVLGHFATAMTWMLRGRMSLRRSRFIHISVFVHMIGIVLLAKGMFHWAAVFG